MTKSKIEAAALQAALTEQLTRELVNYHIGPQPDEKYMEKQQNIVVARNGVFRVISTPIALFSIRIQKAEGTDMVPGVGEMWEGTRLLIPKIPLKYWLQVLTFYRDIYNKDKTEASVLFFWNHNNVQLPKNYLNEKKEPVKEVKGVTEDGQLIIYCPIQENSSGLSSFGDDAMVDWLRKHTTPLLETHSHHDMEAFWSATDDSNENMVQFYMVYGKITNEQPTYKFRFCCGKHKIDIDDMSVLFDTPVTNIVKHTDIGGQIIEETSTELFKGPWPRVEYPEDWTGQHSVTKATAFKGYNYGAYGNSYDYGDPYYGYGSGYGSGYGTGYANQSKGSAAKTGAAQSRSFKKNTKAKGSKTEVIETETSRVEITVSNSMDEHTLGQIVDLVESLCVHGYDQDIIKAIRDADQGILL